MINAMKIIHITPELELVKQEPTTHQRIMELYKKLDILLQEINKRKNEIAI